MAETYLLLSKIVRQVCNHDLGLGGDAVGGGATLTTLTLSGSILGVLLVGLVSVALVCDVGQG